MKPAATDPGSRFCFVLQNAAGTPNGGCTTSGCAGTVTGAGGSTGLGVQSLGVGYQGINASWAACVITSGATTPAANVTFNVGSGGQFIGPNPSPGYAVPTGEVPAFLSGGPPKPIIMDFCWNGG